MSNKVRTPTRRLAAISSSLPQSRGLAPREYGLWTRYSQPIACHSLRRLVSIRGSAESGAVTGAVRPNTIISAAENLLPPRDRVIRSLGKCSPPIQGLRAQTGVLDYNPPCASSERKLRGVWTSVDTASYRMAIVPTIDQGPHLRQTWHSEAMDSLRYWHRPGTIRPKGPTPSRNQGLLLRPAVNQSLS